MERGTSTISTVFTHKIDGLTYEYTTTQQAGKAPHRVDFAVKRDGMLLVKGHDRPTENSFYFETLSAVSTSERTTINNQVNADLVDVGVMACNMNVTTE